MAGHRCMPGPDASHRHKPSHPDFQSGHHEAFDFVIPRRLSRTGDRGFQGSAAGRRLKLSIGGRELFPGVNPEAMAGYGLKGP
jgi:hypothetical protein